MWHGGIGRMYDPFRHAEDLGIEVVEGRLKRHRWGEYRHDERLIVLARGLTYIEARCTLAHEVQHGIVGDMGSWFGPILRRQELLADRRSAQLLVDPVEYAEVERLHGPNVPGIAMALEVVPEVVLTWRACVVLTA